MYFQSLELVLQSQGEILSSYALSKNIL